MGIVASGARSGSRLVEDRGNQGKAEAAHHDDLGRGQPCGEPQGMHQQGGIADFDQGLGQILGQ